MFVMNAQHDYDSSINTIRRVPAALEKYDYDDGLIEKSWEIDW